MTRTSGSSMQLAAEVGQAGVALGRAVGLFAGGAQRTTAVTQQSRQSSGRHHGRPIVGWFAKPARCSAANSQSPERSPVNIRAGAVGAVGRRCEAEYEHPRPRIAEAG